MNYLLAIKDGAPLYRLPLTDHCTLGRSSQCELQIVDPRLSRKHSRISSSQGETTIQDLDSANGTFVNGARIQGAVPLRTGDEILIGSHTFIFNPEVDVLHEQAGDKSLVVVTDQAESNNRMQVLDQTPDALDPEALMAVHRLTCEIAAELGFSSLIKKLLDRFLEHFGADRGFILFREEAASPFKPLAIRTEKRSIAISRALLDRALDLERPILVQDALEDVSFAGSRSIVEHGLRSVMLVPLVADKGVVGLVQVDSKTPGAFDQTSLARLSLLAEPAALAIRNASRFDRVIRKSRSLSVRGDSAVSFVGGSERVGELLAKADKAARSSARVLITGESGTGKELIARMIHEHSPRSEGPWVAVNCAATAQSLMESELFGHEKGAFTGAAQRKKGCFELADQGTLFLDEIGEIQPSIQVKLLRVLQEGSFFRVGGQRLVTVDVRVVAATNRDIRQLVEQGGFRQDLYYRLNVVHLETPALRHRKEDIEPLARFFLERFAREMGKKEPELTPAAVKLLRAHHWPGNVRELKNAVERAMVLSDRPVIEPEDLGLQDAIPGPGPAGSELSGTLQQVLGRVERRTIVQALGLCGGKKAAAARLLGISRPTLDKKIREYNVELD